MYSPEYMSGPSKIFGPAYTVRMVHASDKTSPTPSGHFADSIPSGSVVFISQPKGVISACWGGLMTTRAKVLGAAGVVIDGRFRDINEHREMGMGLFAREISILGSAGFTRSSELNVPVEYEIEELSGREGQEKVAVGVNPGDIILGDADGVVAIPLEKTEECLRLCEERFEIDAETKRCLDNGEAMGPTIKKLRK
ncbi:hypothetical protein ANI_1_792144 [Paecilomyces variotii No. 5]|uniref:Uncharacterized protein n=1 Tax=Byssochlamys spectabilis (strain No. 5 / NBRC 109023) TaxID=1356009 RepID=V5I1F9_BYSSN|nr:hypothetical protein ANI_1_792144 [Paecilomyces variotii No. 5]